MKELFEKINQFHNVFANHYFDEISLSDLGEGLSDMLDANICICSPQGKVTYFNHPSSLTESQGIYRIRSENVYLETKFQELVQHRLTHTLNNPVRDAQTELHFSFFPCYSEHKYLACIMIWKPDGKLLTMEEAILVEEVSFVVSLTSARITNMIATRKMLDKQAAQIAIETLSFSELAAVSEILKRFEDESHILVINELAKQVYIARSVISNALRKLEGSKMISTKSLGMKGTYIHIENSFLREVVTEETDENIRVHSTVFHL